MLLYAVILINSALLFYTAGVWSEKIQGILKKWHAALFYLGLLFDTLGTTLMGRLAKGGFEFNFHGITGALAIILMLIHAIWATVVIIKNNEKAKINFHKFSVIVWGIWLIPFLSGVVIGMSH